MQVKTWLLSLHGLSKDGSRLGCVTVPCLSPQVCFSSLPCSVSWGWRVGCCPDLPGSIVLWLRLGFGQAEVPADQEAGGERGRVFLLLFPPRRCVVLAVSIRTTVHVRQLFPASIGPGLTHTLVMGSTTACSWASASVCFLFLHTLPSIVPSLESPR